MPRPSRDKEVCATCGRFGWYEAVGNWMIWATRCYKGVDNVVTWSCERLNTDTKLMIWNCGRLNDLKLLTTWYEQLKSHDCRQLDDMRLWCETVTRGHGVTKKHSSLAFTLWHKDSSSSRILFCLFILVIPSASATRYTRSTINRKLKWDTAWESNVMTSWENTLSPILAC